MYKVIKYFTDLHDKDHAYNVGDVYPRKGVTVTDERIAELAGNDNKQKTPLIALVEDEELESLTVAQLKKLAEQKGISTTGLKKKADYVNALKAGE